MNSNADRRICSYCIKKDKAKSLCLTSELKEACVRTLPVLAAAWGLRFTWCERKCQEDRIPGEANRSGTIHFIMAQCCEKQVKQQLIDHISQSGPVKTSLKIVKSVWTRPKVSDGSVFLTLNTYSRERSLPCSSTACGRQQSHEAVLQWKIMGTSLHPLTLLHLQAISSVVDWMKWWS